MSCPCSIKRREAERSSVPLKPQTTSSLEPVPARPSHPAWCRRRGSLRGRGPVLVVVLTIMLRSFASRGENLEVPARLQAGLIGKLALYDRNFLERAGSTVVIAIVVRPTDIESARAGAQIQGALRDLGPIAGLPHEEIILPWNGPKGLSELCAQRKVAIVYVAPGLGTDVGAAVKALEGLSVLTIAGVAAYVSQGVVLGFELVSAQTKLVINLAQAKKQRVAFRAEVLKLMRIVQ
jgi:YfiR/HmsC-like